MTRIYTDYFISRTSACGGLELAPVPSAGATGQAEVAELNIMDHLPISCS